MKEKPRLPDPKKAKRFFAKKLAFTTGPVELGRWLKERKDLVVIDVRAPKDYSAGRIQGAVNLPKDKWDKAAGLSRKKVNVVYCYSQTCHLAAAAAYELAGRGFPVMELEGGFDAWEARGLPVEKAGERKRRAPRARSRPSPALHAAPETRPIPEGPQASEAPEEGATPPPAPEEEPAVEPA